MAWGNEELGRQFAEIAALLRIVGADPFRIRAYERAAEAIAALPVDLASLAPEEVGALKGIGPAIAAKIAEFVATGRIVLLDELRARVPAGVVALTAVPGLGPKTARVLHEELGIDSVEALVSAIDAGTLRGVRGLGAKTEANLREAVQRMGRKSDNRTPVARVLGLGAELVARLQALHEVEDAAYAGSLRRLRETIGDVDVLAASTDPEPVHRAFRESELVAKVLAAGDKKTSVLTVRGLQADLRVVEPDAWGAALVYFTGSKAHNVRIRERAVRRGLTLNEYGLYDKETGERVASRSEADVYEALGLPWIPPTLREDAGEVEAAADGRLPRVVEYADLRGDLHGHTDWSGDGKVPLEAMLDAAVARGWSYWAVTDHAENLTINGLSRERMLAQRELLRRLQPRYPSLRILHGAELNIGADGGLDYDEAFLLGFDFCVASIHSHFSKSEAEQTRRIVTAMEHPAVAAIGHPTGRRIGRRPGYPIDIAAVVTAAVRTGTALEVNGSPERLDLSGEHVRRAVEAGATITISSDAHSLGDLDNLHAGVATAQRGWATPAHVLNCRPLDDLLAFVAAKRG